MERIVGLELISVAEVRGSSNLHSAKRGWTDRLPRGPQRASATLKNKTEAHSNRVNETEKVEKDKMTVVEGHTRHLVFHYPSPGYFPCVVRGISRYHRTVLRNRIDYLYWHSVKRKSQCQNCDCF